MMIIDDDRRRMLVYVEELQDAGHEVLFKGDVDSALVLLRDLSEYLDLLVLDVSMPPGTEYKFEDTDGGSRTGIFLYRTTRLLRKNLKVLVLTNVSDRSVAEYFGKEDRGICLFVRKPSILPFQLVELVSEFVDSTPCNRVN